LISGFPRTLTQALIFEQYVHGSIEKVFSYDVTDEVITKTQMAKDLNINQARYRAMKGRYE
jgi:adenylate kinase family enzyme